MRGNYIAATLLCFFVLGLPVSISHAAIYPLEIFTANGQYSDGTLVDLSVDVTDSLGKVDFTFFNNSEANCSIARIYFDDGSLLGIDEITNGPGTIFDRDFPGPGKLPGGKELPLEFVADGRLTIGSVQPPPKNGINNSPAGEWVKISFDLVNGGTPADVIEELNYGTLRVGLHVIGFDDGSSESAILVPEPATILLLGLGAVMLRRKR